MLLFIDTEFTNLAPPAPKLISLGLVSEDGRHAFYAEIEQGEEWDIPDCSAFVVKEVLPLLKATDSCQVANRYALKHRLLPWLDALPGAGPHRIACDSQYDVFLLQQVVGDDWPAILDKKIVDLNVRMDPHGLFEHAFADCLLRRGAKAHNALDDAYANRAGWLALIG